MGNVVRREQLAAKRVRVGGIPGDVRVRVGSDSRMTVELRGPEAAVDAIAYGTSDDELRIDGTQAHGCGEVGLVVTVPAGTQVAALVTGSGSCEIGDTGGCVAIRAEGEVEVTVGRVSDADVDASGAAVVGVARVVGHVLKVAARGGAAVRVQDGSVERLTVATDDRATMRYGGRSTDADLWAFGASCVQAGEVTGVGTIVERGRGRVTATGRA